MGTYNLTYSRSSPGGGQVAVLFQKTDWTIADFNAAGFHWYGGNGSMSTIETTNAPIEAWCYSQLQLIVNFSAATGTSPNVQVGLYTYDDPTGAVSFNQLSSGFQNTNWATGVGAVLTTGMPTTTTTSDVTRPAFVRVMVYTSGTFTALGANNRITLIGIK